uniref:Uncharacterized protein n=1 Tax=Astatotilapia calliptera TaxID=8154 RepID=A0AAX7W6Y2_ASTCA
MLNLFPVLTGDHRCAGNQFQCKNKRCIPVSWHCDGIVDCTDGSDEDAETCSQKTCKPGEFTCANGRCVPSMYVCDAQDDCGDGSDDDEEGCGQCSCVSRCCDGSNDCGDSSDERNCQPRPCSESEFRCDNEQCIPGSWTCNHVNDCGDNSDERDCGEQTPPPHANSSASLKLHPAVNKTHTVRQPTRLVKINGTLGPR